jgi:hypothetical protein
VDLGIFPNCSTYWVGERYVGETHRSMEPTWRDAGPGNTVPQKVRSVQHQIIGLDQRNLFSNNIACVFFASYTAIYILQHLRCTQGAGRLQGLGLAVSISQTRHPFGV